MKKLILVAIALIFVAVVCFAPQSANTDFLRIHIRANSNEKIDQQVKYAVKTAVVEYLAPHLANATTKQKAMDIVRQNLQKVQDVCDFTLKNAGFDYKSCVKLCQENFPDRSYDGVTLPSGVYDALIVELGSGSGNNWWCVVYPPLCFVGGESNGTNVINFKSKLLEIIESWRSSH